MATFFNSMTSSATRQISDNIQNKKEADVNDKEGLRTEPCVFQKVLDEMLVCCYLQPHPEGDQRVSS